MSKTRVTAEINETLIRSYLLYYSRVNETLVTTASILNSILLLHKHKWRLYRNVICTEMWGITVDNNVTRKTFVRLVINVFVELANHLPRDLSRNSYDPPSLCRCLVENKVWSKFRSAQWQIRKIERSRWLISEANDPRRVGGVYKSVHINESLYKSNSGVLRGSYNARNNCLASEYGFTCATSGQLNIVRPFSLSKMRRACTCARRIYATGRKRVAPLGYIGQ